jgi:[acyl-carrier-protein] S-malonyltransferase
MRRSAHWAGRVVVVTLLLSPGQGSQSAGLLRPWLELPGAVDAVRGWSEQTGLDLLELGTAAPDHVVRRTDVAQPLLTAVALLSGRALLGDGRPSLVCGHSVGELSALAFAGVLTDDEAVVLAAGRGRLMAEAAEAQPTGMAAVLGTVELDLTGTDLELATVNVAGQAVVGGSIDALDAWTPPAGARVRRLDVAGAFHTRAMASAVPGLAALVDALTPADAVCDVVANADGARLRDGRELLQRLVAQLTGPVRFDLCLAACDGVDRAVELAPAGVLTPLVRRARPELPVSALRTPADLLVSA